MSTHIMENDFLRVTVSDAGAELTSVIDKTTGAERIWTADPAVWNRHAPILFPFVGKVTEGRYRVADREYAMKTQHGFARDLDFTCLGETPDSVTHRLCATDRTLEIYPWAFRLTVTHRLEGRQLFVGWQIGNGSGERMYYSIGGHPGFLLPEGVHKEDCRIMFPGAGTLRFRNAGKTGYALPALKSLTPDAGSVPYGADIPDTWIFEDGQVRRVGIALPDGTPFVTLRCEGFPMLAVWANPNGPFICLEPWFGRTDDEGFTGTIDQKKAIRSLDKGEEESLGYSIEFL
ncbi:MAG: aldose 1-epimerase family protein [Clostridia bacterium]|nr:aldose 1-epimerase family protein [Clostridia bacterium]